MLSDARWTNNASSGRIPLLLIFFLSGASGLVYEVVWSRSLVLVFGSTTHAVSTVLAAFMGGLALGSMLVGRRGDRFRSPLAVYAGLEIAIAALALGVLAALPAMVPVYRLAYGAAGATPLAMNLLRFLLASMILLPPTTLMGATLPILSAHIERLRDGGAGATARRAAGSGAGALYAANTFGAVAGAAMAGFVLLPALGVTRSALAAAAANLVAAAAAFSISRREGIARSAPAAAAIIEHEPSPAPRAPRPGPAPLLIAFAASGAGALIFEVVWTRILSLVLGSSTQAFSTMLATFLTGLAIGSALATRWLVRIDRPLALFALIELGAALVAFGGVYLFPELPYAFLRLFGAVGSSPALFQAGRFAIAGLVMLPPTLLLGAAFPLAARAALRSEDAVSAPVAALYTANTIGAIAGSCAAGFVLVPALGLQGSLLAGCALNVAASAILLAADAERRPAPRFALAGALVVLLPLLLAGAPAWNGMLMSSGVFQYAPRYVKQFHSRREFLEYHAQHKQLFYRDGPTTTVSVEKRAERVNGQVNLVLSVNGKVDASTVGDMETQVLLGELPMLIAPRPATALIIGLGSGVSAGSALAGPLERLRIVEIEPAVVQAEQHFEEVNGRPLADPRAQVVIDDARNELLVSDAAWDVIISEPSNPWLAGPSKLFTREFFRLARSRLAPGGVLCQWVQLYGMDPPALRALLRTYASVFPHRMIFKGSPGDLLVLGSERPIRIDLEELGARMSRPTVAADLARIEIHAPADLLARFRLADSEVERFVEHEGESALNTDDNALVEFSAARSLYREEDQSNDADLAAVPARVIPCVIFPSGRAGDEAPESAGLAAALAERLLRAGLLPRAGLLVDMALRDAAPEPAMRAELLALRGELLYKKGETDAARDAWQAALALVPSQPRATLGLATHWIAAGSPAEAVALLEKVSSDPRCRLALGRARLLAGDPRGAIEALEGLDRHLARSDGGGDAESSTFRHLYRGRALEALGRHEEASGELRLYFELFPEVPRPAETSIEAAADLAKAYTALNRPADAVAQYRVIASLADSLAAWNRRQATQALERNDLEGAVVFLRGALRWNDQDHSSRRLLGRALNDLHRHEESIEVWREVDSRLHGDEEALRNIAALSIERRRPLDAAEAFRRLKEIEDDPETIDRLESEIRRLESIARPGLPSDAGDPAVAAPHS